jgi:serine/threonine-protein kinase
VLFRLSALIPSVVRPLHVGTLETSKHPFVPFIALEWLDGESLDAVIERRRAANKPPLELSRVVRMMGRSRGRWSARTSFRDQARPSSRFCTVI